MDELKLKAKEIAVKHGKALALEMLEAVIIPAVKEAVAKSENKVDDALALYLEAAVVEAAKKLIAEA